MKNQDIIIEKTKALLNLRCYEGLKTAAGAKWCDCPACSMAKEVLKYKEDLLA